jgi:hypothetical protein
MKVYPEYIRTLRWSTEDFKHKAQQIQGNNWREYYDESKFVEALNKMFDNHDANVGISWITLEFYLNDMCRIKTDNF